MRRKIFIIFSYLVIISLSVFSAEWFPKTNKEIHKSGISYLKNLPAKENFNFIVMSDTHIGIEETDENTIKLIEENLKIYNPEFIIICGDLTDNGKEEEYFKLTEIISKSSIPVFCAIGNHDTLNEGRKFYKKYFGKTNFYFDYGNSRFIIIDNVCKIGETRGEVSEETFKFLENSLKNAPLHKFVFMHIPVDYIKWYFSRKNYTFLENAQRFREIVEKYKVDVVFMGHLHFYQKEIKNGIKYFLLPAIGAGIPPLGKEFGGIRGFAKVEVEKEKIVEEIVEFTQPERKPFPVLKTGGNSPHASLFLTISPPEIKKVKIFPQNPSEKKSVKVEVEIFQDECYTDAKVNMVTLNYSTDSGKTFYRLSMKKDKKKKNVYFANIPAYPKGTKVLFYICCYDNFGGFATEVPFQNETFPPSPENMIKVIDPDDSYEEVPEDIDIQELSFGYDREYLYGEIKVKGKILRGTQQPLRAYGYATIIVNPARVKPENIFSATAFLYAPVVTIMGLPPYGFYNFLELQKGPLKEAETEIIRDREKEPDILYFRLKRKVLENAEYLKIAGVTLAITNIQNPSVSLWDATNCVNLYLRSHEYEIK